MTLSCFFLSDLHTTAPELRGLNTGSLAGLAEPAFSVPSLLSAICTILETKMSSSSPSTSLEAKLVVLGCLMSFFVLSQDSYTDQQLPRSQGVGKTSLVHRYVKNAFIPPEKAQSTIGANFLTTTLNEPESGSNIRLQIWDTAGQERFRSISRLYYRGANAAILAYDVTSKKSFDDMGVWLKELRDNCGGDMIIHIVGTKTDMLSSEPQKRQVPFERCIGYVAEQLYPEISTAGQRVTFQSNLSGSQGTTAPPLASPRSNRSSGFWGQDTAFDCCHEISAKDGEGIDEVFRVITRKLVEQHHKKLEHLKMLENMQKRVRTPGAGTGADSQGYFDLPQTGTGSFRVGHGDKRRSWLNFPLTPGALTHSGDDRVDDEVTKGMRKGRCC